jgi:hypothetical protein
MRVGGKILLAAMAAAVVAVLLLALWQAPALIDANRFRLQIEALASDLLGRRVAIAGPIRLAFRPAPELSAEQVDIGDSALPETGRFHVAALRLRVGLRALLAGRLEPRALVLRAPDLRLPWPLPQTVLVARPPSWMGPFAARIEAGTLRFRDVALGAIDATVAQNEAGLLISTGTADLDGRPVRFSLRLGAPGGDGAATLDAALEGTGPLSGAGATFTGAIAGDGSLQGRAQARAPDLSQLTRAPAIAFRTDGRLTLGDGLAALDEATFDLGGSLGTGAIALRFAPTARLDVALGATRLDLDPWLGVLLPSATGQGIGRNAMPIGVDIAIEAARIGGGTVDDLRARAESGGGGVALNDVSALLPGQARLRLDGRVAADGETGQPRFQGSVQLDAPALRTTLRWLQESGFINVQLPAAPELPAAVLGSTAFTGKLQIQPTALALDRMTGRLDGAAVAGSLLLEGGAHPRIAVDTVMGDLALDPWLDSDGAAPAQLLNRLWAQRTAPLAWLAGRSATMTLRAEHASLAGSRIDGLELDAASAPDGALALRRLEATAAGLHAIAAGQLAPDGTIADAQLVLDGPSAVGLGTLAPEMLLGRALLKGPVAAELRATGPKSALALDIAVDLADARLEAKPVVDLTSGAWRAAVSLRHPDAARLLGLADLTTGSPPSSGSLAAAGWPGEGSLSLTGQFSGRHDADGAETVTADSFDLIAGGLRAHGHAAISGRSISGDITADTLPLPDAISTAPLRVAELHGWDGTLRLRAAQILAGTAEMADGVNLTARLRNDVLTVSDLAGRAQGGLLTGTVRFDATASPPDTTATISLRDAVLPPFSDTASVGRLSGHVDATAELRTSGYSDAAMLATLAGSIRLAARDGALAGFDLFDVNRAIATADSRQLQDTEAALRTALSSGATMFDRLDAAGEIDKGLLRLSTAALSGPAGQANGQGSVGLADGTLDLRMELQPAISSAPALALRLDGPLTAPNRQPELASFARWLAERQGSSGTGKEAVRP